MPMYRALLLTLFLGQLLGCAHVQPSCSARPTQVWADLPQLEADIRVLTSDELAGRKTGTQGAALTRAYLSQRFADIGLQPWQPEFAVPFSYEAGFSERQGVNLVGLLPAGVPSRHWRILVAHYDHLGGQGTRIYHGADDNASGVAALLQLAARARHLRQASGAMTDTNLMFVATDAEEPGLYGSRALVEQLKQRLPKAKFELMVNLDMIGHPSHPYGIYLEGSRNFNQFARFRPRLSAANGLCIRLSHPRAIGRSVERVDWLRASDHYPFHRAGIPWLYFGVPPHAYYHTPDDTPDKIDLPFLGAVTESAFELIQINREFLTNLP
ncbi:M28 family peptidase [Shewanella salipaludis]|uniref:M28 family peptidase n=1 Tax=Shewanella salipaludis TaxID=2723052 RepID=A0A972JJ97_9GAMM|nr:M28 family peptidase [Shewanella salipaludis]NMH65903.1 M28 family peptidase [Shewanella salipaludis]